MVQRTLANTVHTLKASAVVEMWQPIAIFKFYRLKIKYIKENEMTRVKALANKLMTWVQSLEHLCLQITSNPHNIYTMAYVPLPHTK